MPKVGKKKFPYTETGKAAALKQREKMRKKMMSKKRAMKKGK